MASHIGVEWVGRSCMGECTGIADVLVVGWPHTYVCVRAHSSESYTGRGMVGACAQRSITHVWWLHAHAHAHAAGAGGSAMCECGLASDTGAEYAECAHGAQVLV